MKSTLRTLLIALVVTASSAFANPRNAALVISVNPTTRMITVDTGIKPKIDTDTEAPHNEKRYLAVDSTEITVNGLKAEFSDLKPKMRVMVVLGANGDEAASIAAYQVPPKAKKGSAKVGMDRIVSATDKIITITSSKGQRSRSYHINDRTEISVNGEERTVKSLRPGMKVSLTISHDPLVAAAIIASN